MATPAREPDDARRPPLLAQRLRVNGPGPLVRTPWRKIGVFLPKARGVGHLIRCEKLSMNGTSNFAAGAASQEKGLSAVALALAQHPFLQGLKPAHAQLLADNAMAVRYDTGESLFRQGELANRFYLIEQGNVTLEAPRKGQTPLRIQLLGPGDVLGWSWLFPPYLWEFDAVALEPIRAIFFYGTRLREQCEEDPEFGFEMMKRVTQVAIQRLQSARRKWVSLQRGPSR